MFFWFVYFFVTMVVPPYLLASHVTVISQSDVIFTQRSTASFVVRVYFKSKPSVNDLCHSTAIW